MIVRSLRLRHGRLALAKTSSLSPILPLRRGIASDTDANEQHPIIPLNDPNHPVAQDYAFLQHQKRMLDHIGAVVPQHYKPHELVNYPPSPKDITLELLIASQSHLGHATSLWHPANAQYIFGVRGDHDPIHIISPDVTAAHLRRACKVVSGVTERGGLVLFVGTRPGQERCVVKAAQNAKGCHLFTKWTPGSITNRQQILGRCLKKVVDEHDQEVLGFEDQLDSKSALKPDLVICLNPLENYVLLHECGLNNIPTIGIIDTDTNPTWVTYPIAANDDSLRCVQVIAGVLGNAGKEGHEKRLKKAQRGIIEYTPTHGLNAPKKVERKAPKKALGKQVLARNKTTKAASLPSPKAPSKKANNSDAGVDVQQDGADQDLLNRADEAIREANESAGATLTSQEGLPEELSATPTSLDAVTPASAAPSDSSTQHAANKPSEPEPFPIRNSPDFNLWSMGEPGLQPKYTSDPSSDYTPQPRPVAGPLKPLSSVTADEMQRSELDEAGQTTEYGTIASEDAGPRIWPKAEEVPLTQAEQVSRDLSELERKMSEEDPELDGTWEEHVAAVKASLERHARPMSKFDGELDDAPGGQQLDYGVEDSSAGVPLTGISAGAQLAESKPEQIPTREAESIMEQIGEAEKELGEDVGQEDAPPLQGPKGVAPEPPTTGR